MAKKQITNSLPKHLPKHLPHDFPQITDPPEWIRLFQQISKADVLLAGGKGASLGEMTRVKIPVPPGFVILAPAFDHFITETGIKADIDAVLHKVNHQDVNSVEKASRQIQGIIMAERMPKDMQTEILHFFHQLQAEYVAVRSSATAEDGSAAAWAGQLDTFLNTERKDLLKNVQKCWASLFTPRAIFYRFEKGLHDQQISVAVVVQKMVQSEVSGIAFSVHPVTQDRNQLIIEAGFGLGEAIVSGQITPDSYVVEKKNLAMIEMNISGQSRGLFKNPQGGNIWRELKNGANQKLSGRQIMELAQLIMSIEKHYGFPCDIEWVRENGQFYITQSRPITTLTGQIVPDEGNLGKEKKRISRKSDDQEAQRSEQKHLSLYKQEGKVGLYQILLPAQAAELMSAYFTHQYTFWIQAKNNYIQVLFDKNGMNNIAQEFFEKSKKGFPSSWQKKWKKIDGELILLSRQISQLPLSQLPGRQLYNWYQKVFQKVQEMWGISLFIDALDAGFDQEEITKIASQYPCTPEEIHTLLLPKEQSYITTWENMLVKVRLKKIQPSELIEAFFWYGTDYSSFKEIDDAFIQNSAKKAQLQLFVSPLDKQQEILEKYHLTTNPFDIFAVLSQWRDQRKRLNYIGLYGCLRLLQEGLRRQKIDLALANQLFLTEAEDVFLGRIQEKALHARKKEGVLIYCTPRQPLSYTLGKDAARELQRLESYLHSDLPSAKVQEILGNVACPGKVQGTARVIFSPDSSAARKMKSGDILVTSMTRPEFLPLMRKAIAIITDEGGISCHAAIISRELGIPCVIGTKIATQALKDGDLVEVDAEKGIVKILTGNKEPEWPLQGEIFEWGPIPGRFIWSGAEFMEVCCEVVAKEFGGLRWPPTLFLFKEKRMLWLNELHALTQFGKDIFVKYMLPAASWKRIYGQWEKALKYLLLFEKKLDAKVLKKWDDLMLLKQWNIFHALLQDFWVWTIPAELGNYGSPDLLQEELKKYIADEKELMKAMEILTAPEELSFYQQEEIDLVRCTDLQRHALKYFWLKNSYAGVIALGVGFFAERKKNLSEKLEQELRENVKRTQLRKKETVRKYRLPTPVVRMAKVISDNVAWQDVRKKFIFKNIHYKDLFLREITQRFKWEYDDLQNLEYSEIAEIISGKNMHLLLSERKKGFGFYFDTHISKLDSATMGRYWEHYAEKKVEAVSHFGGIVACSGKGKKVKGKVRILLDPYALDSFNHGEILVAPMTSPEYVFAMKKAKAIITDTGGLTSHAAIVSRELGVPCLVGTKIATQALKDGDLVEVDAEKGVVKILTT